MINYKKKKGLIYWFVLSVIILLVLSGLLYLYINSENFRANVKSILITQLEDGLGKNIEIETVDSLSFRSLQLTNFLIFENSSTEEDKILFQAEKAEAKFNFIFSLFYWKEWLLDIRDITFSQASTTITREITGEFDFIRKLQLEPEEIQQSMIIRRINFQDSHLIFHDEMVFNYDQDYLTTRAKDINGYLDLTQLPKIIFDFQGSQEKDNALLALQGQVLINQPEYSLDFHLENADITHFQYYLDVAEQFEISEGQFDLDLNMSFSPELDPAEVVWQGKATFQKVDVKPQFLERIPFNQMSGSIQFTKPEIMISELNGFYRDRNFHLGGLLLVEPEVYFDLDIESERVGASHLKEDISMFAPDYNDFSLQGEVDLTANIKGYPEDFQIDGEASSGEIIVEDIPFQKSDLSFSLYREELIIHSLNISDSRSPLTMNGQFDWSEDVPFYQFSLETENFSLQHALFNQFSFPEGLTGNIGGNFQIENQKQDSLLVDIKGQFMVNSIRTEDFSMSEQLRGNIKAILNIPDAVLSIEQSEFESGQNYGFLNGEINFDEIFSYTMDFAFQVPELTELANSLDLETRPTGRASIEGNFYGNSEQLEADVNFDLQEFSIQDYYLDELTGELTYKENTILLETITMTSQDTKLTGNGNIFLNDTIAPEIDLSYQLNTVDISPLIKTITDTLPLTGQIAGTGQIQGIWPELTAQGNFQLEQVYYQDYQLGQGELDFILQPEQDILPEDYEGNLNEILNLVGHPYSLEIKRFFLQNKTMEMNAEGQSEIGGDNPFSLSIDFSHQNLNEMIEYFYPIDDNLKIYLPSQITGKANLNGNLSEQQISLSAQLVPQQEKDNTPSSLDSVIIRNEQGFTISDFRLIQSEGHFKADGNISTAQDLDINFQAEQLDINMLMNLIQIDETMRGIINIDGLLAGTISKPQVSMAAEIKEGNFREFQFEDLQSDITWDSETNEIEIRKLEIALENDYQIQANGNLPLDTLLPRERKDLSLDDDYQEIPLDFQIMMDNADLNILKLFWKDGFSEVMGNIDLELHLTGTSENPIANGEIEVHQGNLTLDDLPVQIEGINTRIEVSDNQVEIPPIAFTAYENRFNIAGQFQLINLLPENMSLTIKNIEQKIIYQNILESEADFLAEIRGSFFDPEINGEILLSKGELNLDQLQQLAIEGEVSDSLPDTSGALQSQFNIDIEIADPFSLKLPDAEINVTGNINLNGSFAEPSVQGNLVLRKGYLIYFEKRFVLSEGRVSIHGFTVNDVDINARAQTNVQDVQITINVSRNLANPQISLSSQPALRDAEIVSLLTFDRNIEGLSEGEINQLLSEEMVNIIFQSLQLNLFKRMERELADQLGLDFLRLSTDDLRTSDGQSFLSENMDLADLTLEVGKTIQDDLFITYSTPLDFSGSSSININYQISPDFTLNTQFDTYSITDEDYRFKFGLEISF